MAENKVKQEIISLEREVRRSLSRQNRQRAERNETYLQGKKKQNGFQSAFFDRNVVVRNGYGSLQTADRRLNRNVDCNTLRRVAEKAWIINACIVNVQDKIKPYLKPSTDMNLRGFVVHKKGEKASKALTIESKEKKAVELFILNTGLEKDSDRDNFQRFCLKIIRDSLTIDQVAAEIGSQRNGKPYAFWAVDAATIERVLPNQDNPDNIKYIQIVDEAAVAYYPEGTLIFDYQNPRSDIRYSFYGYSRVEQAIDLVTSTINTLIYNSGFFTENKLPRGMLLVQGSANREQVEMMEDYICDIMSGSPSSQWRIPIIPAGGDSSGDTANTIEWKQLGGNNQEMQFSQWLDFLVSGIVCLFGCSMDELGLQSGKSQSVIDNNNRTGQIQESKSNLLGTTLSFLQQFVNRILEKFFPDWEFEFVGYEYDDPKTVIDLAKGKLESFMTLNEVRKEQGLKPLDQKWADECPANPQFTQMYQAANAQNMGGEEGGMVDMGDDIDYGEDGEEPEQNVDDEAWGDISGESAEESAEDTGEEQEETRKSLTTAVRQRKSILVI